MAAILDAGYYHIRHKGLPLAESGAVELAIAPDTAYLVLLKPGKQLPPAIAGAVELEFPDDKTSKLYLVKPQPGTASARLIDAGSVQWVKQLTYAPSASEKRTLEYGLKHYRKEISNVALFVDDLGLPAGLKPQLSKLIPEEYGRMLNEGGFNAPLMISERESRNRGAKEVDNRIQGIRGDGHSRAMYEQSGFFVAEMKISSGGRSCANGDLALCSPVIVDNSPAGRPTVALTRKAGETQGNVPSCGVICAGELSRILHADRSCDRVIAVYHHADDPNIRPKNGDGAFIHAWLNSSSSLVYDHVLLRGDEDHPKKDCYKCGEWRGVHKDVSFENHLRELGERNHPVTPLADGRNISVSQRPDDGPSLCRLA